MLRPAFHPEALNDSARFPRLYHWTARWALGRADACVYDMLSVIGAQKKHANTTRAIIDPPVAIEGYAMAVRHGDTKMVERVNAFLAKIRADGRFKMLQDKYLRELLDAAK